MTAPEGLIEGSIAVAWPDGFLAVEVRLHRYESCNMIEICDGSSSVFVGSLPGGGSR